MGRVHLAESAAVAAPGGRVYGILADYVAGHPRILPPRYFTRLDVERGGYGAGTVFSCDMRLLGTSSTFRAEVSEPEPGRVLVERILDERNMVTTFTVDEQGPGSCQVTIATEWPASGLQALFGRYVAVPALRRVYRAELACIGEYAARAAAGS
ncbi:MAG TPA: SRPBCC family protein [Longimicrobiales bacterium]|nr:SRPBCC family protein [Longimicrobiales bacterium]